jgi:predicted NBD/HSP70 family sugar kinase
MPDSPPPDTGTARPHAARAPLPSLDLLRQLTDSHVLDQLLTHDELTRSEIAARSGISKPTISESVRRLVSAGLLAESGRQVGRPGRAGTYYRLRDDAGVALALSAGPDGMILETCDLRGEVVARQQHEVPSPAVAAVLGPILTGTVTAATASAPGPVRAWALSLAGPVDQHSGRLVHLPDSPFLVDELDPRALVGHLVAAPLQVDNDVNWAALAEHHAGSGQDFRHFFYCYLGPGIGGALVSDGAVLHGALGLAGELAHVRTTGPGGRSLRLVECFAAWQLLQPGTSAIDVDRLRDLLERPAASARRTRDEIATAVAGALATVTALFNPEGVVVGGPWSAAGGFDQLVADRLVSSAVVPAVVRTAALGPDAPLLGARGHAVRAAQRLLVRQA